MMKKGLIDEFLQQLKKRSLKNQERNSNWLAITHH